MRKIETPNHANNRISKKKKNFTVNKDLRAYLVAYSREVVVPLQYKDLLRYNFSMPLLDNKNEDTLWETVYYSTFDMREIFPALIQIYTILKVGGDIQITEHLHIERVDYCTFGNSNPFRIKIVNNFNDNYDYFYLKVADASRIYGLELEHILSPNRINYLVCQDTLIEEHIAGIPGDVFTKQYLHIEDEELVSGKVYSNKTRIAKEFVKFNERCLVKLLGDMRAYNFVIDITPDCDDIQYRIRAIDFDQQCYEGKKNLYLPQFFKENYPFVKLCMERMSPENLTQYQQEERALIAMRIKTSKYRLNDLMEVLIDDVISTPEKIDSLKKELASYYNNQQFLTCQTMGQIVNVSLKTVFHK